MATTLSIRLDWNELDLYGHINNVSYFKYIQSARVHFWEETGLYGGFATARIGPILAQTGCTFLKPLFYKGNIRIETGVSYLKNSSFGLLHKIYNQDNQLVAEANDGIVYFNFNVHHSLPISAAQREKIIPHLISND
ncbi:MAG: acyl-CoA thioesterase [Bacteroidota bacterium]